MAVEGCRTASASVSAAIAQACCAIALIEKMKKTPAKIACGGGGHSSWGP